MPFSMSGRTVGLISLILFILTIPAGNWVVMNVGTVCPPDSPCLIPVWPGIMSPSAVLFAGLALILRDAVQSLLGKRWTLVAIAAGAALSGVLSEPAIILGSTCAFLFSELADFAVYTPLRERHLTLAIVLSGLVGSIVDSVIFLSLAFGSLDFIVGQVIGKFWMSLIAGAMIIMWRSTRRKKHLNLIPAAARVRPRRLFSFMTTADGLRTRPFAARREKAFLKKGVPEWGTTTNPFPDLTVPWLIRTKSRFF